MFRITQSTFRKVYVAGGGGGGASLISPSVAMSRTSGVAPLAIFFDASATTTSHTSRPFHDLEYRYDFGDETVSTWGNGTRPGVYLRNIAFGSSSSHVYNPSTTTTYNPTLQVRFRLADGSLDTIVYNLPSVTVTAANTEWAGSKTVCISSSGNFDGAPAGHTPVTSSDARAAILANIGSGNVRILFRAGETFSATNSISINQAGPSMIGSFGTGAKPIISSTGSTVLFDLSSSSTPTTVSDWRFDSLAPTGNLTAVTFNGSGSFSRMLFTRLDVSDSDNFIKLSGSTLQGLNTAVPFTHAMWDEVYAVDNTFTGLKPGFGPNTVFANAKRMVVMGNNVDNEGGGEHGVRMQLCERGVISYNTIQGIAPTKVNLTIRGGGFEGGNTIPPGLYSEKIIVSHNWMIGGASLGMMGIGPQNGSNDERGRNMIVEDNYFQCSASIQNMLLVSQPDITIRRNLVSIPNGTGGGFAFGIQPSGLVPFPDRVKVQNNTVYMAGSSTNSWSCVNLDVNNDTTPVDQTMPGAVFTVTNNLLYAPNDPDDYCRMYRQAPTVNSTTILSNNTADASNTVSPLFSVTPPSAPMHFELLSGSYAIGAGSAVSGILRDFAGGEVVLPMSIGAFGT